MNNDRITKALEEILIDLDLTIARVLGAREQGEPDAASELKYFRAQRRAYARAQQALAHGLTAEPVSGGAWNVASTSRPGLVHRVARVGEILICDCEASVHGRPCVHKALVEGAELAGDLADRHDDGLTRAVVRPFDPDDDAAYADLLATLATMDDGEPVYTPALSRRAA